MYKLKDMDTHEEMEELAECSACPENVMLMAALKILDEDQNVGELTLEEAQTWVAGMLDADGNQIGETWDFETIKRVLAGEGITDELVEMYTVMNMIKADFGRALEKNGAAGVQIVIDMAQDWLHDPDAKPGKLQRYMRTISK